jgi:hypothetical protein
VTIRKTRRGAVHLLPIYDEYLVAYRDRVAVPHGPGTIRPRARSPVIFQHAVIVDGQIVGTWRNKRTTNTHLVDVVTLRRISAGERRDLEEAMERYGRFLDREMEFKLRVSR